MSAEQTYETVFVARQPIFNPQLGIWGYQLLYRDSGTATTAMITDSIEATLKVMSHFPLCGADDCARADIVVTFPEESLLIMAPLALPPASTVVLVDEDLSSARYVLECLQTLKREGYRVMLGDFSARPGKEALYRMADILALDFSQTDPNRLGELVAEAELYEVPLLARRIEQHENFELAKYLGCSLFQGFFFKRPNILSTRKPSPAEVSRLRLLNVLKSDTPDYDALTASIEADISVSYRLLALLNSPSFGFVKRISSIRQAVLLLGWKQLKQWLRLVILADLGAPDKACELAFLAALRARFLELCARCGKSPADPEALFLLGLFSLLDAMLDTPMPIILRHIFLDDELKAALRGEPTPFAPWLELLGHLEDGSWSGLDQMLTTLGLNLEQVDACHREASLWAGELFKVIR